MARLLLLPRRLNEDRRQCDLRVAVVRTLGVSADELLGLKSSKIEHRKEDPKRRRLWKRFQRMASLPERDQRAVIRLITSLVTSKGTRAA